MKSLTNSKALLAGLMVIACFYACKKDLGSSSPKDLNVSQADITATTNFSFGVVQTNLVSDTAGFGAARVDPSLVNAWGIAAAPNGGPLWISANGDGLTVIYDRTGNTLKTPVTIPSISPGQAGFPTGVVFNGTTDFGGNKFIFASEDGIVLAWGPSSGSSAAKVAGRADAVYKGIVMINNLDANFLCLTNFRKGTVDVFDKNFNFVSDNLFVDPTIPAGFAPFNIQIIQGKVYITYAKQDAAKHDDQSGAGNGYVSVFWPNGTFIQRFASQGTLNSPWGIAFAPAGFAGSTPSILIGNFGDGRINIFDLTGMFKGQVSSGGHPLSIDGLWAIDFLENNMPGGKPTDPLYFTAGPDMESHGLFGTLQRK